MELKNMNGFCELTQKETMEIDGGYRFISGSPAKGGFNKSAACTAVGVACGSAGLIATGGAAAIFYGVGIASAYLGLM